MGEVVRDRVGQTAREAQAQLAGGRTGTGDHLRQTVAKNVGAKTLEFAPHVGDACLGDRGDK